MNHKRLDYIDGLKGVAILMIIINHCLSFISGYGINRIDIASIDILNFFRNGYLGADIFFIIGGFVLAIKYAYLKKFFVSVKDYYKYLFHRSVRLSVPYYLFLIFTPVWVKIFGVPVSFKEFLVHFLYLQAILPAYVSTYVIFPAWFIGNIFWLSLIFPIIIKIFNTPIKRLIIFMGCYWFVVNINIFFNIINANDVFIQFAHKSLLMTTTYFLGGIVVADISILAKKLDKTNMTYASLVASLMAINWLYKDIVYYKVTTSSFWALLLLLLSFAVAANPVASWLSNSYLVDLGRKSYSLYLIHVVVFLIIANLNNSLFGGELIVAHPFRFLFFGTGAVILISWWVGSLYYRFIEKDLTQLVEKKLVQFFTKGLVVAKTPL